MINVTFNTEDDETISQSLYDVVPRVGEKIWFVPAGSHEPCVVVDVCYWISVEDGNSYQSACVYVKPISEVGDD